jgi:hypothetical protein
MDAVVTLLAVQVGLTALVAVGLVFVGAAAVRSLNSATELLKDLRTTLDTDVRPVLSEMRATAHRAEQTMTRASTTLAQAEPAVAAISGVIGTATRKANPLWLDAARLGFGVVRAIKNGRSRN